jgi:hypothetical protein
MYFFWLMENLRLLTLSTQTYPSMVQESQVYQSPDWPLFHPPVVARVALVPLEIWMQLGMQCVAWARARAQPSGSFSVLSLTSRLTGTVNASISHPSKTTTPCPSVGTDMTLTEPHPSLYRPRNWGQTSGSDLWGLSWRGCMCEVCSTTIYIQISEQMRQLRVNWCHSSTLAIPLELES